MTDAAIYTRVSSAEQLREGFSIAAQEKILREYSQRQGLRVAAEFSDDETAKSATGRPGFRAMLAHVQAHPGTVIVVEKVDRLYRNLRDYLTLDDLGVELHFVREGGREVRSSDARLMHGIRVLIARKYVENLSEEVKKGMRQKCEEGGWPTWAPLGYVNVKDAVEKKRTGGIVLDPVKAPLVRELFESAAKGMQSLGKLATMTERIGLRGRSGARLSKQVISNVLRMTAYFGEFDWGGKRYRGKYETLIDRDLFDRVQVAMREGSKPKVRTHTFAFAGMIRCGACGGVLTGDRKKGRFVYYFCGGKRSCKRYYAERLFDGAMSETLRTLLMPEAARTAIIAEIDRWYGDESRKDVGRAMRVRARLTELQTLSGKAYEDKILGVLPEVMWRGFSDRWREEESRLRAELITLQPAINRAELLRAAREPFELLQVVAEEYLGCDDTRRSTIVQTFASNLFVNGGKVSIQMRSPFDVMAKIAKRQPWLASVDDFRTLTAEYALAVSGRAA